MATPSRLGICLVFCLLFAACDTKKPEPKAEPAPPEKNRGYQVTLADKFRVRLPLGFPKPTENAKKEKTPFGFIEVTEYYTTNSSNRVEQINLVVVNIPEKLKKELDEKKMFEVLDRDLKESLNGKIESADASPFQGHPARTTRFFGEYKRLARGYGSSYAVEDNIHGVNRTVLFGDFAVKILYTSAGQYDRDRDDSKEFLDSLEVIPAGTGK
jgi:hypothetical protein